jgi:hypothetical protein
VPTILVGFEWLPDGQIFHARRINCGEHSQRRHVQSDVEPACRILVSELRRRRRHPEPGHLDVPDDAPPFGNPICSKPLPEIRLLLRIPLRTRVRSPASQLREM